MDEAYDNYFGFTSDEVHEMLDYYGVLDKESELKDWYDGYLFGSEETYLHSWSDYKLFGDPYYSADTDKFWW